MRVSRREEERFADVCIVENDRYEEGSIMVWGEISRSNRTSLYVVPRNPMKGVRNSDEVLEYFVLQYTENKGGIFILMDDNVFTQKKGSDTLPGEPWDPAHGLIIKLPKLEPNIIHLRRNAEEY